MAAKKPDKKCVSSKHVLDGDDIGFYVPSQGYSTIDGPAETLPLHARGGDSHERKSADSSDVTSEGIKMHKMRCPAGPGAISKLGDRLQQQKASSERHEKRVAKLVGGRRVPGSGSLSEKGDVRT